MTWPRVDAIRTGLPARTQWPADSGLSTPGPNNMVAVAGDVVVTATTGPVGVTLRFINAKTGALVATRSLTVVSFTGIRADTIGAEPVVEAQYVEDQNYGLSQAVMDTVFDTSGRQVWTNGGRDPSNYVGKGLLVNHAGGLVTDGHTVWFNPGTDALHHGGSYTVQDLSGNALLTVPYWAPIDPADPKKASIFNWVQLAGDYAVVIHFWPGETAAAAPDARFTVYDLSRGAKVVAAPIVTFPEGPNLARPTSPPNPDPTPNVVAACGSKIVLALTDPSWTGPSIVRVTVLDVATGRTTPPVDVRSDVNSTYAGVLSGLADAACSTMILNGQIVLHGPAPVLTSFAIDLSTGTLLWQKPTLKVTYHYLSIHGGVVYALRNPTLATQGSLILTTQGRLIAFAAASGATLGTGYTAVPLAYTADGTPIFARVPHDPAPKAPSPSLGQYVLQPGTQLSTSVDVQLWAG